MIAYSSVLILLVALLFKPQPTQESVHPLIGKVATVEHGYAKGSSYFSSSPKGTVLAIDDDWITLSTGGSSTVTIPASRVHVIYTE
jgi:hypothetical protein